MKWVLFSFFTLIFSRTVWQRLARTSGKVLQSKWAWGAGAIAGGLAIRQGYNQYLEKLARGEKGSYVKGHLNVSGD